MGLTKGLTKNELISVALICLSIAVLCYKVSTNVNIVLLNTDKLSEPELYIHLPSLKRFFVLFFILAITLYMYFMYLFLRRYNK